MRADQKATISVLQFGAITLPRLHPGKAFIGFCRGRTKRPRAVCAIKPHYYDHLSTPNPERQADEIERPLDTIL